MIKTLRTTFINEIFNTIKKIIILKRPIVSISNELAKPERVADSEGFAVTIVSVANGMKI